MISYNFPYRGPFEYDKAAISILSYVNESNRIKIEMENESMVMYDLIHQLNKQFEQKLADSKSRKAFMLIEKIR